MMTSLEGSMGEDGETDGGSEGKSGSLYSASSDPGYSPIGDLGMKGGEGAGGTKTVGNSLL